MYDLEAFGAKTAWIAARNCTPEQLAQALHLTGGRAEDPSQLVSLVYDWDKIVVLPPLPGVGGSWTLAPGNAFFHVTPKTVAAVSATLGQPVQAFATHRVVELHSWMLADQGRLLRHFAALGESGDLGDWTGRPTPAEVALELPDVVDFTTSDEAWDAMLPVNEQTVFDLARAWSIDPYDLDEMQVDQLALVFDAPSDINAAGRGHDPQSPPPSRFVTGDPTAW